MRHTDSARRPWRPWRLLLLGWLRAAGAKCPYPVQCPTPEEACPSVVCPGGATILEITTAAPQDTFVWPLWPPAAPPARRRRQAQATVPTSFTVDWGDGSPPTQCLDAGAAPCAHTYAAPGRYTVTADPGGRYPVRAGGWALTPAWHAAAPTGLRLTRILQWGELRFHETSGYHLYAAPGLTYVPSLAWLPDTGLVQSCDYSFARLTTPLSDLSYGLNLSGAVSAVGLFENSAGLASLYGTSAWDTRRLRNASRAFAGLPALTELDLSRWDTALLEDVTELFAGGSALTRTGVGGWTSLPSLSRFDELFRGLGSDFQELLAGWSTPALAPGSADCTRLAPYTALGQTRWPAACSRSLFLALVRTHSNNATATLTLSPAAGPGQGGTYGVDWEDGSAPGLCAHAGGAVCTHVYASAGDYWLRLSGRVDGLRYVESAWVVDVVAWGDVQLYHPVGSTTPLFARTLGGSPLRYLAPTAGSRALHGVAPEYLLYGMSEFVGDARDWDWSWLTPATHPNGLRSLFEGCIKFNQDLGGWSTSGVASLGVTFRDARAFNGNIGGWDTSQVTNLQETFRDAWAFNQPIGGWNTGRVTTLWSTFQGAFAFNQPIGSWDVSRVRFLMNAFRNAYAFNQNLDSWNVGMVISLTYTFACAPVNMCVFNQPLGSWGMSPAVAARSVTDMFSGNCVFDQNLTAWNLGSSYICTDMFQPRGIVRYGVGIRPSNLPAACNDGLYVRGCGIPAP